MGKTRYTNVKCYTNRRAHQAGSHQKQGWEEFTDAVIRTLSQEKENLIFLLWGRFAQNKAQLIDDKKHFVLKAAHPHPFQPIQDFSAANTFQKQMKYLSN